MTPHVRFSETARRDLARLYDFLAEKDHRAARRAIERPMDAARAIARHPFRGRPVGEASACLRERRVPFGGSGYWLLYEMESAESITILTVRHEREETWSLED